MVSWIFPQWLEFWLIVCNINDPVLASLRQLSVIMIQVIVRSLFLFKYCICEAIDTRFHLVIVRECKGGGIVIQENLVIKDTEVECI